LSANSLSYRIVSESLFTTCCDIYKFTWCNTTLKFGTHSARCIAKAEIYDVTYTYLVLVKLDAEVKVQNYNIRLPNSEI